MEYLSSSFFSHCLKVSFRGSAFSSSKRKCFHSKEMPRQDTTNPDRVVSMKTVGYAEVGARKTDMPRSAIIDEFLTETFLSEVMLRKNIPQVNRKSERSFSMTRGPFIPEWRSVATNRSM